MIKKNETELSAILFWFLFYERNATETGKEMHMHRNTVNYHIQRITDMLEIDLNDYMTRYSLMTAYHYLEVDTDSM